MNQSQEVRAGEVLGVKNMATISKPELVRKLLQYHDSVNSLMIELYCENPRNRMFDSFSEQERAALQKIQVARIAKLRETTAELRLAKKRRRWWKFAGIFRRR